MMDESTIEPIWVGRDGAILARSGDPKVMGILNTTPDSFTDGGETFSVDAAVAKARTLVAAGAHLIDIGGESSRPGAEPVSVEEELRRVVPVIEALASTLSVPISIDTAKTEVARRAIAAGASIVNTIRGAADDPEIDRLVAETGVSIVIMHMQGNPQTMQLAPTYANVVSEVIGLLRGRIERLEAAGVLPERIAVDPGIGFGKRSEHNRALLRELDRFATLGKAILVGVSRKRFLGSLSGREIADRDLATVAASLWAIAKGASIVRVHNVSAMIDAILVWQGIKNP